MCPTATGLSPCDGLWGPWGRLGGSASSGRRDGLVFWVWLSKRSLRGAISSTPIVPEPSCRRRPQPDSVSPGGCVSRSQASLPLSAATDATGCPGRALFVGKMAMLRSISEGGRPCIAVSQKRKPGRRVIKYRPRFHGSRRICRSVFNIADRDTRCGFTEGPIVAASLRDAASRRSSSWLCRVRGRGGAHNRYCTPPTRPSAVGA